MIWHEEYSKQLIENGFQQGKASPCVFYHESKGIRTVVHGDDYISVGKEESLQWMEARLKCKYEEKKNKWLGPQPNHSKEVRVLNRVITWEDEGISYEADPRHVEIMIEELGLQSCVAVGTPGTSAEGRTKQDDDAALTEADETRYRALVARANYLAPDRADIVFAVKELAQSMAKPTTGDWARLKRLGRYLSGRPRLQTMFKWQTAQRVARGYSDADWAGDKEGRKSISGGCIVVGSHLVKGWSKTQSLIAFSSAESELYASLRTSSETLGVIAMAKDMGYQLRGQVLGYASAALGIIHRKGLGKTRHIDTSYLWIQEVAARRRLLFSKVLGKENPADLYTKHLDVSTMDRHVVKLECRYKDGRACAAPQLHTISISWCECMAKQESWETYALERESMKLQQTISSMHNRSHKVSQGSARVCINNEQT